MIHFLLDDSQEYIEETFNDVKTRYVSFGKDIYKLLKDKEAEIFNTLKFYRATKLTEKTSWGTAEIENSYAIYDDGIQSFGIQLEPITPVICLHNERTQIEIGDWDGNNYYAEAIKFIKEELMTS
ncbi:conserved hypothetical protein [Formosa agariphila KMM 3901]|uniref:Uncharacterized protein n=1 Tax=Formosa agariphila (strain DSM 15362 / KCTC 12365 / LMG 23005 / KMM 3901 / M-2Alg 35-1) TaxID=1347342 RepID=T2KL94_FORAG|nr:hypothetical protein [Formosa agariphila]CDF79510.1 conserved hypothetical protein [Formosa agariphila KMM 3901]